MVRNLHSCFFSFVADIFEVLPRGFLLCSPFGDGRVFRETIQRYYFPLNGYSSTDFIITNGGLMGIIGLASAGQLGAHGIDPASAADIVEMCSNNVSKTLSKLSIYLEPKITNIECLLFGVSRCAVRISTSI